MISDNTVTNQNEETITKTRTNYNFVINEKNMRLLTLDSLKVGDEIPALTIPPLTSYTLALYFGASGGHNPFHVDIDFAKLSRLDEVIVQGMFSTGFLVRLLTNWAPQPALRSSKNRFVATNHINNESVTSTGKFIEIFVVDREQLVRLELQMDTPQVQTIVAEAVVALD